MSTRTLKEAEMTDAESRKFYQKLRAATRQVYIEEANLDEEVAAAFGDALTFYLVVGQLDFKTARALANAGYFYPNEVITASDAELLKLKGLGPSGLRKIRRGFDCVSDLNASVRQFVDAMTGQKDETIPFPLPTRADCAQLPQSRNGG